MPADSRSKPESTDRAADPCRPEPTGDIRLPVIADAAGGGGPAGMRASRMGRWRAVSLIAVHVVMIAHVWHWLQTGTTISPLEPSEAKDLAMSGVINAGLILFALAIASTLLLGRYFCGWGCHLIAYQDFTLWLLKKLHLRPRAFRSRLLIFVPLIAALYMFVWPAAYRFIVRIEPPPISLHLTTSGFWDTFPGLGVAVLTIFICGVAIIYFLGPKGFCTYACPYGGFFGPVDKLAVGRIRVTEDCNACGHCTATCTSNVDVAREVKLYGMVVSPGCMKCMDCVSVCPTHALYFGFGPPAIGARPASEARSPRYDLTLTEELAAGGVFIFAFLAYRALYEHVPFLLALGIAGVIAFCALKAAALFYQPHVSLQKLPLRIEGRLQPIGRAFLLFVAALIAFTAHSAWWRYHDFRGNAAYARLPGEDLGWQHQPDFAARLTPEQQTAAATVLHHLGRAERIGLMNVESNNLALSWAFLVSGDTDEALRRVARAIDRRPDDAMLHLKRATYEVFAGRTAEARKAFRAALDLCEPPDAVAPRRRAAVPAPLAAVIWADWALFLAGGGDALGARQALDRAVKLNPDSSAVWGALGGLELSVNRPDDARPALVRAVTIAPHNHEASRMLEQLAKAPQDFARALADYDAALARRPGVLVLMFNRAYALVELGRIDGALAAYREIVRDWPEAAAARADLGALLMIRGDLPGAVREYEEAVRLLPNDPEASLRLAFLYEQSGRVADARRQYQQVTQIGGPAHRQAASEALARLGG